MISILIGLLILAVVLWVVAMVLDMVLASSGLPPQVKPVVLAILGLLGLVYVLRGWGVAL